MIIKSQDDDLRYLNHKIERRGQSARWEGWTIKVFRPDYQAAYRSESNEYGERPVFFNGTYGWERTVEPDSKGFWKV